MTDHERAAKAERLLAAIREYALVRVRDSDPDPGWRSILALATPLPEAIRDRRWRSMDSDHDEPVPA